MIANFIGSFYSDGDVYGLGSGQLNDGPLLQMNAEFDDFEQIFRIFSDILILVRATNVVRGTNVVRATWCAPPTHYI